MIVDCLTPSQPTGPTLHQVHSLSISASFRRSMIISVILFRFYHFMARLLRNNTSLRVRQGTRLLKIRALDCGFISGRLISLAFLVIMFPFKGPNRHQINILG